MAGEEKTSSLNDRVLAWISKQGYPLEFYAADAFAREGFSISQGTYVNQSKDKPRELDLIAEKKSTKQKNSINMHYVVECKYSKDKPWIVLSSMSNIDHIRNIQVLSCIHNPLTDEVLKKLSIDKEILSLNTFDISNRYGFNVRQAFTGKDEVDSKSAFDICYSAIQSIASASRFLATSSPPFHEHVNIIHSGRRAMTYHYNVILLFPMIVIDGQLFDVSYNAEKEEMVVQEVPQKRIYWQGLDGDDYPIFIDIVTKSNLRQFVKIRSADIDVLQRKIEKIIG